MNATLVMFKADGTRREFPLAKPRTVLGRTNNCDLRIPLSSVSRQHCEVVLDGQAIKLRDLGSSNGTYHNSVRVQESVLRAGDEIVIGPVVFTLVVDGQPQDIKPVRTIVGAPEADVRMGTEVPAEVEQPQQLPVADDELPEFVEPEHHSPTVDLDDPIAALEAMAQAETSDEDVPLLADDDDDDK